MTRKRNRDSANRPTTDRLLDYKDLFGRKKRIIRNAGIYFLFKYDKIIYIGQTINGLRRIYDHLDKGFTGYTFISCKRRDLNKVEAQYIKMYSPCYNVVHNGKYLYEIELEEMERKNQFEEIPNKCLDCKTEFDIRDKVCPDCGGRNIRLGGRFKVIKKQSTEEMIDVKN